MDWNIVLSFSYKQFSIQEQCLMTLDGGYISKNGQLAVNVAKDRISTLFSMNHCALLSKYYFAKRLQLKNFVLENELMLC